MSKFLTTGVLAGALSLAGAITVAVGYPAFGAFLSDANTAVAVTAVASGVVAGAAKGLKA